MGTHKSLRNYHQFSPLDLVTDQVIGSDGSAYAVTLRGFHWHILDWFIDNSDIMESWLVDISVFCHRAIPENDLSKNLEVLLNCLTAEQEKIRNGENTENIERDLIRSA